jgi:hypothetical protein
VCIFGVDLPISAERVSCVFAMIFPVVSPLWFPIVCLPCDIFGVNLLLINDFPRKNGINKCKITTDDRLCPRLIKRGFLTIINFTIEATSSLETRFWVKSSDFGDFFVWRLHRNALSKTRSRNLKLYNLLVDDYQDSLDKL